jgi:hypothetical protein
MSSWTQKGLQQPDDPEVHNTIITTAAADCTYNLLCQKPSPEIKQEEGAEFVRKVF